MKSFFIPEVQTPHQSSRVHFLIFHRLLGLAARDLEHCYLQPSLIIFTQTNRCPFLIRSRLIIRLIITYTLHLVFSSRSQNRTL